MAINLIPTTIIILVALWRVLSCVFYYVRSPWCGHQPDNLRRSSCGTVAHIELCIFFMFGHLGVAINLITYDDHYSCGTVACIELLVVLGSVTLVWPST